MAIPHTPTHVHYIKDEARVSEAVGHLLKYDLLGFDTETYNTIDPKGDAFEPTRGVRMRLVQFATPMGRSFVFDLFHVKKSFLYLMFPNPYLCVGQNLKFDIKFLMYELGLDQFGELFDTMTAGQLNNKGRVAGADNLPVSLAELAMLELGVDLSKEQQASNWASPVLSQEQIEYSARDPLIVLPIYEKQVAKLKRESQIRVAQLEFNTIPALADIELNGMAFDGAAWEKQYHATEVKIQEVSQPLWDYFGTKRSLFEGIPTIALGSQVRMIEAFHARGLPVPFNKKTERESLDGKLLAPYEQQYPVIKQYKEYKGLAKSLSSYGLDWLDMVNPEDGRIHASYRGIGAETGRMSCSKPNLQQVPKENEYRNCLIAAPGWVIVGYDYSQMELRILCEYCRDPNFLKAFDEGYDLHRYTASLIFKIAMEAVTGKQRGIAKNLNFGIVYGIGVLKFSNDAGIPLFEAKKIMDFYLKQAYPFMSQWLDRQAHAVIKSLQARTMTGRIRQYWGNLDEDGVAAKIQRNGKNLPIQGTSVDITKRALHLVFEAIRPYRKFIKLIHVVHDEIILEAKPEYVQRAKDILSSCMLEAEEEYLKRVKCVVDGSVTLCWTKEATDIQIAEAEALYKGVFQL